LTKLGFVRNKAREIAETVKVLQKKAQEYGIPDPVNNRALQLAGLLHGKFGFVYAGGEHFQSVTTRWKGQVAENGKALMSAHVLPEMNHNEIVGWHTQTAAVREGQVIFLRDRGDHKRIQQRLELTKAIISERTSSIAEAWSEGTGLLARMFSLIYLGDWTSYYLAILHGEDPTPVKVIDQLKEELGKA
jgi:glucose/mannose-6-phosphate isomerase